MLNKKIIVETDNVLFKSAFNKFLQVSKGFLIAKHSLIDDRSTFKIKHSVTLPLPEWKILRPMQSGINLNNKCIY